MGLCWDGLFQSLGWRFLDRRRTLLRTLIHDVFRLDCLGGHFEPPDPPPPDPDFNDLNHDHKNAYYVDIHGYLWMSGRWALPAGRLGGARPPDPPRRTRPPWQTIWKGGFCTWPYTVNSPLESRADESKLLRQHSKTLHRRSVFD